ncbi:MAG: hypothetical protein IJN34_00420 [Clostridia bacterium]|nr:hypothetical protein [Clostridia bacterium]
MAFKVVVIQSAKAEAEETASHFYAYGCDILAVGTTGRDAVDLARKHQPDILIMEPFLPYLNCDEIVALLNLEKDHTAKMVKMVISDEKNDRMADRFLNNGGDLFLMRPLDYSYCLKRMEQYHSMRLRRLKYPAEESPVRSCTRKLQMKMRMPTTLNGFLYVQDAVELCFENPRITKRMVADFYPAIAARYRINPQCVERSMRDAVEKTFEHGSLSYLQEHFSHVVKESTGKPYNREFIIQLTALVREDLSATF